LWSVAQFNSALPKNRTDCDIPLVSLADYESLRSRAEKAEAERDEARDTNRKLHRRLQLAEAVQQSAEDYLGSWLQIFTPSRNDRRGERHFIMYILRDAKRHVDKLSERYSATYRKEASNAEG
jgi:hypothetical protein